MYYFMHFSQECCKINTLTALETQIDKEDVQDVIGRD
jgi:hypothetical protein